LAVSEDIQLDQNRQITSDGTEQISQAPDMADNSDDNFFDEEFEEDKVQVADPLSLWNKAMFHFNDKLYFWALKPLARGYKAVAPDFFRAGVKNFSVTLQPRYGWSTASFREKGMPRLLNFQGFL
jgi:ABC-type transporter lipoprotein component MlaA